MIRPRRPDYRQRINRLLSLRSFAINIPDEARFAPVSTFHVHRGQLIVRSFSGRTKTSPRILRGNVVLHTVLEESIFNQRGIDIGREHPGILVRFHTPNNRVQFAAVITGASS